MMIRLLTEEVANQTTTEQYVNAQQDFQLAPGDVLGINVEV